jgi:hypothetical protein
MVMSVQEMRSKGILPDIFLPHTTTMRPGECACAGKEDGPFEETNGSFRSLYCQA